jgi:hypothetical protein
MTVAFPLRLSMLALCHRVSVAVGVKPAIGTLSGIARVG